jgi:predicted acylesterase/phospholipase RssA
LHEKDKETWKLLYLVGVNASRQESEVFSFENTPDLVISDAVRISMSLPGIFQPHQQYLKKDKLRQLNVGVFI